MRAGDDIFWEINRKVVSTKGMLEEEYHAPTCRLGCRYDNAFWGKHLQSSGQNDNYLLGTKDIENVTLSLPISGAWMAMRF